MKLLDVARSKLVLLLLLLLAYANLVAGCSTTGTSGAGGTTASSDTVVAAYCDEVERFTLAIATRLRRPHRTRRASRTTALVQ